MVGQSPSQSAAAPVPIPDAGRESRMDGLGSFPVLGPAYEPPAWEHVQQDLPANLVTRGEMTFRLACVPGCFTLDTSRTETSRTNDQPRKYINSRSSMRPEVLYAVESLHSRSYPLLLLHPLHVCSAGYFLATRNVRPLEPGVRGIFAVIFNSSPPPALLRPWVLFARLLMCPGGPRPWPC